jgi:hypothetical protein
VNEEFTKDQTGFWGAIAGIMFFGRTYLNYKQAKLSQKDVQMEVVKVGIKETKEVLDGLTDIGAFIIVKAKDGIQLQDGIDLVSKIISDPEFKSKMEAMVGNINLVPAEIKDLDIAEGVELIKESYDGYNQIMEALKK